MNREFKSYLSIVLLAFVITIGILNFFSFYLVSGSSMAPTLKNNNYLIVKKGFLSKGKYERGDIIVFNAAVQNSLQNEKELVKRVIAIPGDTVKIENNKVYVNNEIIKEDYLKEDSTKGSLEITVDGDSYFVLGDNRMISLDSREDSIGLINEKEIMGEVIIKMFPFERIGDEINEN
jgi:signal peptidase I